MLLASHYCHEKVLLESLTIPLSTYNYEDKYDSGYNRSNDAMQVSKCKVQTLIKRLVAMRKRKVCHPFSVNSISIAIKQGICLVKDKEIPSFWPY